MEGAFRLGATADRRRGGMRAAVMESAQRSGYCLEPRE